MSASTRAVTRWATRIIPGILAGCVGFATWVVVDRVCVEHFLLLRRQPVTTTALLVVYFVFLLSMIGSYLRLLLVILYNPGLASLGPGVLTTEKYGRSKKAVEDRDLESQRYQTEQIEPDVDPDSPGLERFYSKDVFICGPDGRPRYCSNCRTWKIDRTHHSSEIDRCVRKMDHFCPWVGGIVSETSFKFFVQFTFYATLYCSVTLTAAALGLKDQVNSNDGLDGTILGVLALGAFFGFFSFGMTATSVRFVLTNQTNVEVLRGKSTVHQLAIRIPLGTPASTNYGSVDFPLPKESDHANDKEGSTSRDRLARRTFAIVKTQMGENPWDLGILGNWKSVMGANPLDWFLPFNHSPCASYENNESFYEMGPLYRTLRTRYNLPEVT